MNLRASAIVVALLLMLTACADSTANSASEPAVPAAVIESYAERQSARSVDQAAASPTPSVAPTTPPTTAPPSAAATPEVTPTAVHDVADPAAAPSQSESTLAPMSDQGVELGCADATEFRRWFDESSPAVSEAASILPGAIWICPATAAVSAELECYGPQTAAILDALETHIGETVAPMIEQIRDSNTVFCASGDVLRLDIGAVLDRLEAQSGDS